MFYFPVPVCCKPAAARAAARRVADVGSSAPRRLRHHRQDAKPSSAESQHVGSSVCTRLSSPIVYLKKQISLKNCIIIRDSRGDFEICIISSRNRRFDSGHENIMEDIIEDFISKNTKRMILFSRT